MYTRHGFPQIAYAQNEIILSAGTYATPLLLMKSGIGPENVLNAAEVRIQIRLETTNSSIRLHCFQIPVKVTVEALGKNLADHPLFILPNFSVNDSSLFTKLDSSQIATITENFHNGNGVLTQIAEGQSFVVSSKAEASWPDLLIIIHPMASVDGREVLNFYSIIGRPQSRGLLTMDTEKYKAGVRDDVQLAVIDQKLLTHTDDVEAMLDGNTFLS